MTERVQAWVGFALTEPFVMKRIAVTLALSLLPAAALLALGQGVLALLAISAGAWPFPLSLSVRDRGVVWSWFFLERTISFTEIASVRIIPDPRRWALLRRSVLELGRQGDSNVLIFAKRSTLSRLEHAIVNARRNSRSRPA